MSRFHYLRMPYNLKMQKYSCGWLTRKKVIQLCNGDLSCMLGCTILFFQGQFHPHCIIVLTNEFNMVELPGCLYY